MMPELTDVRDQFNAFLQLDPEGIAGAIEASLRRAAAGESLGPLDGLSVAIKDNLDVAGMATRHGSTIFDDEPAASRDAPVVARLRAAGAAILGKTRMTELACGTDGLNTHFGNAHNPWNPDHHTGGSSSGSAVAVASGLVPLALGSDTGGSTRIPAAACGVVGLKPSFGRVPTLGMGVCARKLDHIGVIASSVPLALQALVAIEDAGGGESAMLRSRLPASELACSPATFSTVVTPTRCWRSKTA
ncbi:MAG: aspartyl-tRNA(Asn)/glutamyl-tRNA(Gln) amidotransferase subunit A [Candidatus Poriferisodalaceae bacterium]|jgi:aspartyl-tRNA(Asn)/glutamyl-tRNA(Gln) amidotransferase subunit A